jgi:hypothetical protein
VDSRPADARFWPAVAVDASGVAVAMWVERPVPCPPPSACTYSLRAADFSPASGTWSPSYELATSNGTPVGVATPSVGVDANGSWHAVWLQADGSVAAVETSSRTAGSSAWQIPVELSGRDTTLSEPALAVDARGDAVVVWSRTSNRSVEASYRRAGETVWSRPETVATVDDSAAALPPHVGLDGRGNAVAVWAKLDLPEIVQATLRPFALGRWLPPTGLGPSVNGGVDLGVDASGGALAIWSSTEGIDAARLDGRGPVIAQAVVPGAAAAGSRITFRTTAAAWQAPLAGEPVWRFGDGATAAGATVVHTYRHAGRYSVDLTVRDGNGDTTSRQATVEVTARPPRNLRRPRINGASRAGRVLTCTAGTWSAAPRPAYRFAWLRGGKTIGTGARHRLRRRDVGATVRCRVVARNEAGVAQATSLPVRIRRPSG